MTTKELCLAAKTAITTTAGTSISNPCWNPSIVKALKNFLIFTAISRNKVAIFKLIYSKFENDKFIYVTFNYYDVKLVATILHNYPQYFITSS